MADERCTVSRIAWVDVFPFVRLLSTFQRAVAFGPMVLALAAVVSIYVSGRIMDAIWTAADHGVLVAPGRPTYANRTAANLGLPTNEIEAYAMRDARGFEEWKANARKHLHKAQQQAEELLAEHEQRVERIFEQVAGYVSAGRAAIAAAEIDADEKERLEEQLLRAADIVRLTCEGFDTHGLTSKANLAKEVHRLMQPLGEPQPGVKQSGESAKAEARLLKEIGQCQRVAEYRRLEPRGVFITLLDYEMRCFAAAVQGALAWRWGFDGQVVGPNPSMAGAMAAAGNGLLWFFTQRPCYATIFALLLAACFALFGGAICRIVAVKETREETLGIRKALTFARQKFAELFAAPLLPAIVFLIAWALTWLGGLLAAVPWLEVINGLFYALTLLGGVVMAATLLAVVMGFHLMWPVIALESSDAFDAAQRAASYVFIRTLHLAGYALTLLLYGALSFAMVRVAAMLVLKLTHAANGAGMNTASAARLATMGKLDVMWHMPAWNELPLLPAVAGPAFWGSFHNGPLALREWCGMGPISFWVFLVVALVGAFVVSFYFAGSVKMYLLLRRTVDGVDYDEIYYEEPAEPEPPAPAAEVTGPAAEQTDQTGQPEQPTGD